MTAEFCEEHSNVMRSLGELKQGQTDVKEMLVKIDTKIDCIGERQTTVRLNAASEKTKSGILYWVLGVAALTLVAGIVNLVLKALGLWK